ncbi:MurR/RpiR family transcriptional regulator [Vibrio hannami]|uniref:MurR/RpiR family transcriptional regulator n=1 Tax=Vibrio hannami TaxID=2717094 RepID=UPI002410730E|nr:MurR/RpiR family transcriptional regulator [Vibrio hannami]MDG3086096.1 MurR/RpiR family transcriptional regulator [Vibrio hannami]
MNSLTPTEKVIANYFVNNFTVLPYAKVEELCEKIGIGKATLGRFLNRLGFTGFLEFKKKVSDDLVIDLAIPIERCKENEKGGKTDSLLNEHLQETQKNLEATYNLLSQSDFNAAIDHLLDQKGKLYVLGSASAEALANYFFLLARYLRKDVELLKADTSTLPHQLVDVNENDTLLTITYHRFSNNTIQCTRWFNKYGGRIIAITDQQVNPLVSYSDILFTVDSQSESIFNNRTSGFFLIEALIKGMSSRINSEDRFAKIENTFNEFNIFKNN